MHDPTVSDILVNTYRQVYVERYGKIELTGDALQGRRPPACRSSTGSSRAVGRRIDESSPMVDARLADGSRVNAIIPPLAVDGPALSIRRFAVDPLEMDDLLTLKTAHRPRSASSSQGIVQRAAQHPRSPAARARGKTTLLNVLSRFIPTNERIVTIEDSAELQLQAGARRAARDAAARTSRARARSPSATSCATACACGPTASSWARCAAPRSLDMLQAMNTGHDGSLTTIHANTPRDALLRLETMVAMTGLNIPSEAMRRRSARPSTSSSSISRLVDGSRKVVSFQEITGMEGDIITMQEIFAFEQTGIDENGRVKGRFVMRGFLPKFMERFAALGEPIPYNIFDSNKFYEI